MLEYLQSRLRAAQMIEARVNDSRSPVNGLVHGDADGALRLSLGQLQAENAQLEASRQLQNANATFADV